MSSDRNESGGACVAAGMAERGAGSARRRRLAAAAGLALLGMAGAGNAWAVETFTPYQERVELTCGARRCIGIFPEVPARSLLRVTFLSCLVSGPPRLDVGPLFVGIGNVLSGTQFRHVMPFTEVAAVPKDFVVTDDVTFFVFARRAPGVGFAFSGAQPKKASCSIVGRLTEAGSGAP